MTMTNSVPCVPRFCTTFNETVNNTYEQAEFISFACDRPWNSYQQLIGKILNERNTDGSYKFPVVIISLPRQCGKTTLIKDTFMGRVLFESKFYAAYTAQTGQAATERFTELYNEVNAVPFLAKQFTFRRSSGTERVSRKTSHLRTFPPVEGGLRGGAYDLVIVDEAQEFDEVEGKALDLTINPTQSTRHRRQLIISGTAGTLSSSYFKQYIDNAKNNAPGHAIIEYGFCEGEDPTSKDVWFKRHPGLNEGLTDLGFLEQQKIILGTNGFAREYGNCWIDTQQTIFEPTMWRKCQKKGLEINQKERFCFAVDITPDRQYASIAVCGQNRHAQIIESRQGVDWVLPRITDLALHHKAPIVVDAKGTTGTIHDALMLNDKIQLITPKVQDIANATADFVDDVRRGEAKIVPHPDLDKAVANASFRNLGEGFAWDKKARDIKTKQSHTTTINISPLVAITLAMWGYGHMPKPKARPILVS